MQLKRGTAQVAARRTSTVKSCQPPLQTMPSLTQHGRRPPDPARCTAWCPPRAIRRTTCRPAVCELASLQGGCCSVSDITVCTLWPMVVLHIGAGCQGPGWRRHSRSAHPQRAVQRPQHAAGRLPPGCHPAEAAPHTRRQGGVPPRSVCRLRRQRRHHDGLGRRCSGAGCRRSARRRAGSRQAPWKGSSSKLAAQPTAKLVGCCAQSQAAAVSGAGARPDSTRGRQNDACTAWSSGCPHSPPPAHRAASHWQGKGAWLCHCSTSVRWVAFCC